MFFVDSYLTKAWVWVQYTWKKSIRCYVVFLKQVEGISEKEHSPNIVEKIIKHHSDQTSRSKQHESATTHIHSGHVHTNANDFQNAAFFFVFVVAFHQHRKRSFLKLLSRVDT